MTSVLNSTQKNPCINIYDKYNWHSQTFVGRPWQIATLKGFGVILSVTFSWTHELIDTSKEIKLIPLQEQWRRKKIFQNPLFFFPLFLPPQTKWKHQLFQLKFWFFRTSFVLLLLSLLFRACSINLRAALKWMFIVKGGTKAIRLKKQSQGAAGQRAWRAFRSQMISALAQIGCTVGGLFTFASTRNEKLKCFCAMELQDCPAKSSGHPKCLRNGQGGFGAPARDRSASKAIHTWLQPLKVQQAAGRILLVWIMAESFWIQIWERKKKIKILMFLACQEPTQSSSRAARTEHCLV